MNEVKLGLLWSHETPDLIDFNPLIHDIDNDDTPELIIPDKDNNIYVYPIKPLTQGVFQFRGDRTIFEPKKWLDLEPQGLN